MALDHFDGVDILDEALDHLVVALDLLDDA